MIRLFAILMATTPPAWLMRHVAPQLLQALNEKQMKKLGMKINASDIYSISKGSLKDAIVSFGGFVRPRSFQEKD